jgi:hypothetical protein
MKRLLLTALLAGLVVIPFAVQAQSGWKVRADKSTSATDPDAAGEIKFMAMGSSFHAVNPSAAVFWNPANTAMGTYTLKGTFTLMEPSGHNNYYGLVFGGGDLEGPNQTYIYFMVAQDGSWLIKQRAGDATANNVSDKTPSAAVVKPDASGKSVNALEVHVKADAIDYVVNGTVVHTTPKTGMTATTDGIYGFRVNHRLEVMVEGLEVVEP